MSEGGMEDADVIICHVRKLCVGAEKVMGVLASLN